MSEISGETKESLRLIEDLKFFLATAPANWQDHQVIRRYYLNNDEGFVSCVFWNNLYFITGTDIVRCILYKFQHFGRTITDRKKFEEGIFSDLRNLKSGEDAVLENPKLDFLEFLYKNSCLRTQKKQKVFYWFNVPHDKLMADALERDIKKEKLNQVPTLIALREPALLFQYVEDKSRSLYEQLSDHLTLPRFDADVKYEGDDHVNSPEYAQKLPVDKLDDLDDNIDDDDFPLDYLDKGPEHSDYITLDSNYQTGSFINSYDSNFDSIDPIMFQAPVNVANTEDYLIEQTVPLRPAALSTLMVFPRLARIVDDQQFLQVQTAFVPTTASGQMPRSALMGQFPPLALVAQFPPSVYEPGYFLHETPVMGHSEQDYYQQVPAMAPVAPVMHFEPASASQYYGYFDEYDYNMRLAGPSQRQQEISASMMRKRQQLQRRGVLKPERRRRAAEYEARLQDHLKSKGGNKLDENLILTPELSVVTDAHNSHA